METETLSSYEQHQDKHILNDGVNDNISNHDDDSNSLHSNGINEAESDTFIEPVSSSNKKNNGENCDDETVSSSENKVADSDKNNIDGELGNVSSTNYEQDKNYIKDALLNSVKHNSMGKETNEEMCSPSEEDDAVPKIPDANSSNAKDTLEEDDQSNKEVINSSSESVGDSEKECTDSRECNKRKKSCDSEVESISSKNNEDVDDQKEDTDKDTEECPLLKETLTKPIAEDKVAGSETGNDDEDMDDDFDPSLLCPDIAMEVDEAPVITNTEIVPVDGNKSPQLYDPVYSTYVDEMTGAEITFNLSNEEHQMRQELYGEKNPIQFTKIHCTACNVHLGSALDGQGNRFVHPLLKVLICKDCYHFYTSGEFEKDEDGSELYCRWCGQGGQVLCCSSCEMVFCKKCIRINFGRRKLTEIRDSDDWSCFRCDPSQLTSLRVHCAEFMEYVRREISRAATLENAMTFMTTDYTHCCAAQKKKSLDPQSSEPKKKRKKHYDPDYEPDLGLDDSPKSSHSPIEIKTGSSKIVPIMPKPMDPNVNTGFVKQLGPSITPTGVFKVGNTTFKPRYSTFSQVRPMAQVSQQSSGVRPQTTTPTFIKILPGGIRATSSLQRQPAQTFVSTAIRPQSVQSRMVRPSAVSNSAMKHEWFEKTVRAAARVNSNLSYTLTQLNRAQSTATSVEALAVVHNKLQEILSTSINSLIQIRKNLRTEFIAGIKNIRFPPKPNPVRPQPSTSSQDDDVIIVSPTSSPVPPPLPITTSVNITPSVTLTNPSVVPKRNIPVVPTTSIEPIPSTSTNSTGDKPKLFLRVKSLSALQNVPSECITIPDDPVPLPAPPPLVPISQPETVTVVDDTEKKEEEDPLQTKETETEPEKSETEVSNDKEQSEEQSEKKSSAEDTNVTEEKSENEEEQNDPQCSFSLKEPPSLEMKKMLNIKVHLDRSEEIDELVRNQFGLLNGNTSE